MIFCSLSGWKLDLATSHGYAIFFDKCNVFIISSFSLSILDKNNHSIDCATARLIIFTKYFTYYKRRMKGAVLTLSLNQHARNIATICLGEMITFKWQSLISANWVWSTVAFCHWVFIQHLRSARAQWIMSNSPIMGPDPFRHFPCHDDIWLLIFIGGISWWCYILPSNSFDMKWAEKRVFYAFGLYSGDFFSQSMLVMLVINIFWKRQKAFLMHVRIKERRPDDSHDIFMK